MMDQQYSRFHKKLSTLLFQKSAIFCSLPTEGGCGGAHPSWRESHGRSLGFVSLRMTWGKTPQRQVVNFCLKHPTWTFRKCAKA